ncbi:MAG TPA: glycosyltransferase [Gemmatimonadaceae bacterium]|nr:glycosyltransferase [Gemmatimonadaceae bacterium]
MRTQIEWIIIGTYAAALFVLSLFSLNRYVMISLFRRYRGHPRARPPEPTPMPRVTVQLPVYNELFVAERLIRSACALDYPRHLLQVQVLDDSTDETLTLTRRLVRQYRAKGFQIEHLHREDRTGYKAGALEYGLERAMGELVAVFDADFVIPRDFLRNTVPYFSDPNVGVVQARWDYLNEDYSLLTRVTALGLSGQFVIEQPARDRGGLFLTFNGTAGVLRTRAIRDAGGWQHDTLTEDLDLSYRAQLAGWRIQYLPALPCPSELPPDMHALKTQQYRWTKGSQETARKLFLPLWRAAIPLWQKLQGTAHLLGNSVYPFLLVVGILNPIVMFIAHKDRVKLSWAISAYFLISLGGTFSYYAAAIKEIRVDWRRRMACFPLFLAASIGLSVYNAQAAIEGFLGKRTPFLRTPKYNLNTGQSQAARRKRYRSSFTNSTLFELALGIYTATAFLYALYVGEWGALPFLLLFATGYLLVGGYSVAHVMNISRVKLASTTPQVVIDETAMSQQLPAAAANAGRSDVARVVRPVTTLLPLVLMALLLHCDRGDMTLPAAYTSQRPGPAVLPAGTVGLDSLPLVQKDAQLSPVAPQPGDPTGMFWFVSSGPTFDWRMRASGLTSGRAYRVQLSVDGQSFDVASSRADSTGALIASGRLFAFMDQVCMGGSQHPSIALAGHHVIGVVVKNDGAPRRGGETGGSVTGSSGSSVACSGNGDGDFGAALSELHNFQFSGT